ncbi:MAG: Fic family protein [Candidatus Izemoplasmatales bacterium]|jgi:Fic family protein|nr:Fic family protein [Candidatus Izemoplasmatales bacterium]
MRVQEVETLKQLLLDKKKAISEALLTNICDEFDKHYIYESTSFDNGNFTYEDVSFLLEDHSRLFPDKDELVRKAIINNHHALKMIHKLASEQQPITESIVKDLHQLLVEGIIPGGVYRTRDLFILGAKHVPPSYLKIFSKMNAYFADMNNPELQGIAKAAFVHLEILKIYPFMDANGRLARLLLNYQLELDGFLPISIIKGIRNDYFKNIDEYKINKNIVPFTEFLTELEYNRITDFLSRG